MNGQPNPSDLEEHFNYSSKKLGSGLNCPDTTEIRFSDYAL
jgi:hypothetical protein